MEHRCGTRVRTSIRARLSLPSRVLTGRIIDLSLSGAFVALADPIPEQTRLVVEVAAGGGFGSTAWRVAAYVVWRSQTGVGIEWEAFAPWPVLALLRREACSGPRLSNAQRVGSQNVSNTSGDKTRKTPHSSSGLPAETGYA